MSEGISPGVTTAGNFAHLLSQKTGCPVTVGAYGDLILEVPAVRWVEVARLVREDPAVDAAFFSYLTAVDAPPEFTVVAYLRSLRQHLSVVLKTRVPRDNAVLPSLWGVWAGANWHEREAWDLFGIRFQDHPDLRRILLWEGYEGHPLRKDFMDPRPPREPVTRGGRPTWLAPGGDTFADRLMTEAGEEDGAEELVVNVGPQHPSTHGVLRVVTRFDGEVVSQVDPVIGYLHRNFEKICENLNYAQIVPFCDRNDYLAAITNEWAYCRSAEQLLGIEVPERAEYLRV
ncbi:MAG TPA: hypothetical protein GX513_11085, partial [Firmicutes bacterium]|nr:hypothetical protein [Bacillota bacterium]